MIFYFQLAVSLLLGLIVFILEVIVILCLELYIVRQNRQRARMVGHLHVYWVIRLSILKNMLLGLFSKTSLPDAVFLVDLWKLWVQIARRSSSLFLPWQKPGIELSPKGGV